MTIAPKGLSLDSLTLSTTEEELSAVKKRLSFENLEKDERTATLEIANTGLRNALMNMVRVAMVLSELHDRYTAGHQRRVGELSMAISAELGFDELQQEGICVAGYLHDVGKVTIPSEILSKHGKLTEIECSLVKGHARAGYDVLKRVALPWPIAEAALQHHERMNGSGYPQGLEGDDILFNAQIIAVADTIEAMTSDRPYRVGLGIEKTLAEIERGRGSLYNPTVVDCSLKLFREKGYKLPR